MCEVVNKKHEPYDVYIGRGSKWGNPFVIGRDGTREEVIAKYRVWLWQEIKAERITWHDLTSLEGKRLGCFCKPLPCHGDVIKSAMCWAFSL
ncbi:DUF4326 domain-containing protein [Parendozoicomonas haliclonae]|uniref:DUF4326 domain-containing protein n=2 Tax=Parendozoicomonas haliclonae TaxID=1960125 RepID=A0A1X7AER1_9GAMM|nr:hypothetical protein EHSB41UT_00271 [Parendozoicomonas haliclonae]